jgi:outer membrane lipoprotein carrier protein
MPLRHLLVLLLLITAAPLWADAAAELDARWGRLQGLEADFVQVQRDTDGSLLAESSGRFALSRPGRFRWDYQLPYVQTLVSDGETVWVHDPDLRQVTRRAANIALDGTPAALLASETRLGERFDVIALPQAEDGARGWRMTPREADAEFTRIDLWMQDDVPQRLLFSDPLGGETEVRFSAVRVNPRFDRERFRFRVPRGHDVVEVQ